MADNQNGQQNKGNQGKKNKDGNKKKFGVIVEGPRHKLFVHVTAAPFPDGEYVGIFGGSQKIPTRWGIPDPNDSTKQLKVKIQGGEGSCENLDMTPHKDITVLAIKVRDGQQWLIFSCPIPELTEESAKLAKKDKKKIKRFEIDPCEDRLETHDLTTDNYHSKVLILTCKNKDEKKEAAKISYDSDVPVKLVDVTDGANTEIAVDAMHATILVPASGTKKIKVMFRGLAVSNTFTREDTEDKLCNCIRFK